MLRILIAEVEQMGESSINCKRELNATSDRESRVCGSFPKDRSCNKLQGLGSTESRTDMLPSGS
jgi:transposase-like protein